MSVRSFAVIAALVLSSGSAIGFTNAIATAQLPFQVAQRKPHQAKADWLRELNLNSEQLYKIQEIRSRYQERLTDQKQAVRQAQQELKQLMASNAPTEQLRRKFDELQSLKQTLGNTRMESMLAIRNVLTAEQRQKLNAILQQQAQRRRELSKTP